MIAIFADSNHASNSLSKCYGEVAVGVGEGGLSAISMCMHGGWGGGGGGMVDWHEWQSKASARCVPLHNQLLQGSTQDRHHGVVQVLQAVCAIISHNSAGGISTLGKKHGMLICDTKQGS